MLAFKKKKSFPLRKIVFMLTAADAIVERKEREMCVSFVRPEDFVKPSM
jgi:hypothetical protein